MPRNSNQSRAFADLVSIDAWHDQFGDGVQSVSLHADVTFGRAPFGAESESNVTFRLSVKEAELVLVVPSTEPAIVDKRTVLRLGRPPSAVRRVASPKLRRKF